MEQSKLMTYGDHLHIDAVGPTGLNWGWERLYEGFWAYGSGMRGFGLPIRPELETEICRAKEGVRA